MYYIGIVIGIRPKEARPDPLRLHRAQDIMESRHLSALFWRSYEKSYFFLLIAEPQVPWKSSFQVFFSRPKGQSCTLRYYG